MTSALFTSNAPATRAALRAVSQVLVLATECDRPAELADVLASARNLQDSQDHAAFRCALERLARRHRRFAEVLAEYDDATDSHPELWFDCGEAD